ncbi:restriction endonuclease [Bacillus sp. SD075]|uniref:nSTAND3 domain-containing NTPase n=1 Tax=Bacillus sp. SD075 TaxID=2781732 RepID=UPI001A95E371|nr:restriction endonuclease [Bacillus sp. SD075]MBO1000751.1 restriction endonuclease [Bacillus sp. SD075]
MGKYNLHLLGWKAFENLVCNIMQHTLGATYTPFSEGKDGGRDGYFEGKGPFDNNSDRTFSGKFVFQCKRTTNSEESMTLPIIKDEIKKIQKLVNENNINHYIIFTNRKISAGNDLIIRERFLKISGLESCTVLGSEWFDSTIDGDKRLRRLVPRLYGIGDLSEIIDERVYKQSHEIIEDLKETVTTFVSTKAYQDAITAVLEKRFVILLGPPASGKSAIATNICMSSIAEDESNETLILEDSTQFKEHWNPDSPKKVYWFDDVFGITNLDNYRLNGWLNTFVKLNVAIKKGATVIFTSRDYIFNEAREKIKESAFKLLFDSQVIINVGELSLAEKQQILYNHIKSGDLARDEKKELKPLLNSLSKNNNFSPELARRLGNKIFHNNININQQSLSDFFANPVSLFEEVIKSLDESKKAALILILLQGNQLHSPVKEEHIPEYFKSSFDATLPKIKSALEIMKNSLVKLSIVSQNKVWSFYHPSMIDSLQIILSKDSEMIELFIYASKIQTLIRDLTCKEDTVNKIFVPKTLWYVLEERFTQTKTTVNFRNSLTGFMLRETSDEFLIWLKSKNKEFLESLVMPSFYQLSGIPTYEFACRLEDLGLLEDDCKGKLINKIKEIAIENCDVTFITNGDHVLRILGEYGKKEIINTLVELGPEHFRGEFDALMDNIESDDQPDEYFSNWFSSIEILLDELRTVKLISAAIEEDYGILLDGVSHELNDYYNSMDDYEEDYLGDYDDNHDTSYKTGNYRIENNIFSDVDE